MNRADSFRIFLATMTISYFIITNLYINEFISQLSVVKASPPIGKAELIIMTLIFYLGSCLFILDTLYDVANSDYPIKGYSSYTYDMFKSQENSSQIFGIIADKYEAIYDYDQGFERVQKEEILFGDSVSYLDYNVKLNYLNG